MVTILITFLSPTDENEVNIIVKSLKEGSSGFDNISSKLIKQSLDIYLPHLVYIINLSFASGTFPDDLKLANVLPLFKSGSSCLFINYRPISLLTGVSKVFEKLFYNRLYKFLIKNDILYNLQFGFLRGRSTDMALITLVDKIIKNLENDEYSIGIFLDFSKAFDTVDHGILLNKLEFYGIRGTPLSWLHSYLSNRKQFTTYNGFTSSIKEINCGVPQGSILGPLLFLLYINDLAYVSKSLFTIMYADDTNCFISGKDLTEISNTLNVELSKLVTWLKANKLSLNITKTHYMVFAPKRLPLFPINIKIDGCAISQVTFCKFLGVIIDDSLSWCQHINFTKKKMAKVIGILYNTRKKLSHSHLCMLYRALINPYLFYCNIIWSSSSAISLEPLIKLQKQAIRCIFFLRKYSSTAIAFEKLKAMNILQIRIYLIGIFMYKFHHHLLPGVFNDFFVYNYQIHSRLTRQSRHLHPPRFKSNLSKNFLKYEGVILWNRIFMNIDTTCTLYTFKKHLRNYVFSSTAAIVL